MSARAAVAIGLAAIVAVATIVHTVLALGLPSPWIVPDELIYSELAKSLGAGRPANGYGMRRRFAGRSGLSGDHRAGLGSRRRHLGRIRPFERR